MDKELETLIDEVRLLYNALVSWGDRLHAGSEITMGMRAVLEFLARNGASPVPTIARSRRVSRQFIQTLVNGLLDGDYVESTPNPAHSRSPLIALTRLGESTIRGMRRREAAAFDRAELDLSEVQLKRTATTLRALRTAIET
jgi:DNA-binding MarR family transcriptional regulator